MRRIPLLIALIALLAGCDSQGEEPAGLRIALDFQPNAVHAGLLRSSPIVPSSSTDSLKLLLGRRVDMSVVDIHDLGLARERGEDIVGVGAVVQRPLAAVNPIVVRLTLEKSPPSCSTTARSTASSDGSPVTPTRLPSRSRGRSMPGCAMTAASGRCTIA